MELYLNRKGDSGVVAYQIGKESIVVQFQGGATFRYDYNIPGRIEVETMKALAKAGRGLSTFISTDIQEKYAEKLR